MMKTAQSQNNSSHAINTARLRLQELINHLREDVQQVNDSGTQALFETSAEVLAGLEKVFAHHERKSNHAFPEQIGPLKHHGTGVEKDSRLD